MYSGGAKEVEYVVQYLTEGMSSSIKQRAQNIAHFATLITTHGQESLLQNILAIV